jgi:dihydropteroate synthase
MRFLRRHQYLLCFLGVLVFSCVMVLRQFLANQSAHAELREDFILLHERGEANACEALYQELIQALAGQSEQSLVEDLERTSLLVDPKSPDVANPVWKYHVSVKNELQKRSEQRLARVLKGAENR